MRCTLAALTLTALFVGTASGCDRSGQTRRPEEGSLHLPRVGSGESHAEERARPHEAKRTLPRTSPRTLQDALQKEIELIEHIVELWWASRAVHDETANSRVGAAFADLRDQARSMDTAEPYTEALRFALCSLGDGHLRLVDEPGITREYFSGLHFDRAGEDIFVSTRSEGTGKGAQPKPVPGDKLIAADGSTIDAWMERLCLVPGSTKQHRRAVALGSLRHQSRYLHEQPTPRKLTLQRQSGETYTIDVGWRALNEETGAPCVRASMLDKQAKVGLLRLRTFWCLDKTGQLSDLAFLDQLAAASEQLEKAERLIVDLRGNPGGTEWAGRRVLGMLRGDRSVWSRVRTRHPYRATSPTVEIEHRPVEGEPSLPRMPMVVLVDAGCADACELLAGALQGADDITMIGRATAGSVGTTTTFRLPYTGLRLAVPITEHALPGTSLTIEGRGIAPDVEVVRARSDIANGADADLQTALERIRK